MHETETRDSRALLAAAEIATVMGISIAWYWATPERQSQDWLLGWDMESWNKKLTSFDTVRFDSNEFHINAFGHSMQSVLTYHAGRGNGFGFLGSALLTAAHSIVWEYTVEYRELPSLNDLVVNTVSGPALGEPLWQIGEFARTHPKTLATEAIAFIASPFDEIEHRIDHRPRWREQKEAWHRFQAGAGAVQENGETQASVEVDLEVTNFDRPGARSGWTLPGQWSRIAGDLQITTDGLDGGSFSSRTSYGGYNIRDMDDEGHGTSQFLGVGTGVTYEGDTLGAEKDQFAAYHVLGPQFDLHAVTDLVDVHWQAAAYGDFAMVHALAIGEMPPIDAAPPYEDPLAGHGYYFGVGASAWSRLAFSIDRFHLDLEAHAHQVISLDSRDQDRGEPDGPKDLSDGRVFTQASIGVDIVPDRMALDLVGQFNGRRGTVANGQMTREERDQSIGLQLTVER